MKYGRGGEKQKLHPNYIISRSNKNTELYEDYGAFTPAQAHFTSSV